VVAWEERYGAAKIAPLAFMTEEWAHEYVAEHDVPVNPLLERGYKSIGCEPQTRPVAPDEGTRAGRWSGIEKTECGLHWVDGKIVRGNA
jgi:phosphoadenosine phosphosulfate reductase